MAEFPTEERLCWCGARVFTYYGTGWFVSGMWPPVRHDHEQTTLLDPDELLSLGRDPEFEGIPVPPLSGVGDGPVPWPSERGL